MTDQSNGPEKKDATESENRKSSKPASIPGKKEANSNAQNSQENKNYTYEYLKIAYKWAKASALPWIKRTAYSSNFWIAAATVAIAVTTIVYTKYARRQWRTMLISNQINRDSLTSVQRAFVSLSDYQPLRAIQYKSTPHYWIVSPIVENSGTTPAVSTINSVSMDKLPSEPDERQFKGKGEHFIVSYIGPKHSQALTALSQTEPFIFGADLGDPIKMPPPFEPGKPSLFIWGWVGYRDIFDIPHVTEFCTKLVGFRITVDGKNWTWSLSGCENHNCVDEFCPDYQDLAAWIPEPKRMGKLPANPN